MRLAVLLPVSLMWLSSIARAEEPAPEPAAAPSGPVEVLVLGGGKTPEEAEAWMKRWTAAASLLGTFVKTETGYPRVLPSAQVEGLNPGFHIVVLGFCAASERQAPHKLIKAFFPGTYSKPVKGREPACPFSTDDASVVTEHSVRKDDLRLAAVQVKAGETASVSVALFQNDTLLEEKTESFGPKEEFHSFPQECSLDLKGTKSRAVVSITCDIDAPLCANFLNHYEHRKSYAIDQGKLVKSVTVLSERHSPFCD
ncbi:hypothetical protein P2318_29890 [Myxococcaceae bacterium GXIMD 01537]